MEIDSRPTIEEIQTLASLTTLKVNVADAIVTEFSGRTGGIACVLVVHGSVTLGVDLRKARFESVNQKNRTAVLVLPEPTIQSVALDQEKTKIVALWDNGLWIILPGQGEANAAATNLAYREAQKVVARAADDRELIEQARRQAERVLKAFIEEMRWRGEVHWLTFAPVQGGSGPGLRLSSIR
jgi:hypothetical protein